MNPTAETNFDAGCCPLCGQPNECRMATDAAWKGPCWCEKADIPQALLAQVPAELRNKNCICRNCVAAYGSQKYKTAGAPAAQPGDFYFENGLKVFTAAYLRRRGYCCDNGCRHCPYKADKKIADERTK